jgi:predicted phage baseplate assembly protein
MTSTLLPLPNLDDRRWSDLVDEARTLIPVYSPAWTDHNAHDPGITLLEMLAWIAETDIYRVNQIPGSHIRAFLALIGLQPVPPSPARAVVALSLTAAQTRAVALPATTLFDSPAGKFQSRQAASILPVTLAAVQVQASGRITDKTGDWRRCKPFAAFGSNPQPGDCLYLGFHGGLEKDDNLSLHLTFVGDKATEAERQRLLAELAHRSEVCSRLKFDGCPVARAPDGVKNSPRNNIRAPQNLDALSRITGSSALPPHHSVAIAWEIQTAPGIWQTVEADDDTRSFTLSGSVVLSLPAAAASTRTGAVATPLAYVRARFVSGAFDEASVAARLLANAVEVEQAVPIWDSWAIAPKVVPSGTLPSAGDATWIKPTFDDLGHLSALAFTAAAEDALAVRVLAYEAATDRQSGLLTLEAKRLGTASGAPNQVYRLAGPELREADFRLYTVEPDGVRLWRRRANLAASGPADADFLLGAGGAAVQLGDGHNGLVPPFGATVVAVASETAGSGGNVAAGTIMALDRGPHNVALLGDPAAVAANFEQITNPDPAWGGTDEESLTHAEGRALQRMLTPSRAVTLADCEALALANPGTALARAAALANQHPAFQCYAALGFITLVIVPYLPLGRPVPSPGLIGVVSAYVNRRRVIGTRIEVVGPEYLEISVIAEVKACVGQSKTAVREAVVAALQAFLDPLAGGPDGTGWPLGREVPISEILDVIARVPGVDHVLSLGLSVPGCGIQCGNVCLRPLALTVSGAHQIQVR